MHMKNKIGKTISAALVSVIIAMSLVACGSTENSNTQSTNKETQNVTNEAQNGESEGPVSTSEMDQISPEAGLGSETTENNEEDTASDDRSLLLSRRKLKRCKCSSDS